MLQLDCNEVWGEWSLWCKSRTLQPALKWMHIAASLSLGVITSSGGVNFMHPCVDTADEKACTWISVVLISRHIHHSGHWHWLLVWLTKLWAPIWNLVALTWNLSPVSNIWLFSCNSCCSSSCYIWCKDNWLCNLSMNEWILNCSRIWFFSGFDYMHSDINWRNPI